MAPGKGGRSGDEGDPALRREAPVSNAPERPVWFVGDLDDPWVSAIAEVLPGDVARISCAGDWHEPLQAPGPPPGTLIVHRPTLTPLDLERLARLRKERTPAPRVILCVGPYARHGDLERCAASVDVVLPEATARETLPRHVPRGEMRPPGPRPAVAVVSDNFELRQALADACTWGGYRASPAADWSEVGPGGLAVWDVPVLEPDWTRTLSGRSKLGAVVALLGFADRELVRLARAHGASACLDSPCDLDDLVFVLDRLAGPRIEPAHDVPPPPAALRRPARTVAEPRPDAYN